MPIFEYAQMAPTDLSTLALPAECRGWLLATDPRAQIVDRAITVNLTWWNRSLQIVRE